MCKRRRKSWVSLVFFVEFLSQGGGLTNSNSVKRRPRQRSATRTMAPKMSLSVDFSPKPVEVIVSCRRSSTNGRSSWFVARTGVDA